MRWPTRLWDNNNWITLAKMIQDKGLVPLLLGGEQEHENNLELAEKSGALYLGHFSLKQYINLIYQCDIVVTQVSMAMHLTIGLGGKIVLMNNIFNPYEFELFGKGFIVQPNHTCVCYFKGTCSEGKSCMQYLKPESIMEKISLLAKE
jgi:heptosyltransferase-2